MKVRSGFVSNSSSSSFLIATKNDLNKKDLIKLLDVNKKSPLFNVAEKIASLIVEKSEKWTEKQFLENYGYDSIKKFIEDEPYCKEAKIYEKYKDWNIYYGSVYSDDYEDTFLYGLELDIETDDLVIYKEE